MPHCDGAIWESGIVWNGRGVGWVQPKRGRAVGCRSVLNMWGPGDRKGLGHILPGLGGYGVASSDRGCSGSQMSTAQFFQHVWWGWGVLDKP